MTDQPAAPRAQILRVSRELAATLAGKARAHRDGTGPPPTDLEWAMLRGLANGQLVIDDTQH